MKWLEELCGRFNPYVESPDLMQSRLMLCGQAIPYAKKEWPMQTKIVLCEEILKMAKGVMQKIKFICSDVGAYVICM